VVGFDSKHFVQCAGPLQISGSKYSQRVFDFLGAAAGLVVLSPLLVILAVAIKIHDGGPVFYRALRVGKDGRLFRLFKFRSMIQDADRRGAGITVHQDTRVTPLGKVLRRAKLDELPQLINVVTGEMSIVGPRPEDPRYVALYTDEQRRVLAVRPGITSLASLHFRNEEEHLVGHDWESLYVERILPQKLAMELEYHSRRTLRGDLVVIFRTLGGFIQS
jgi:lipopolysaccharide/colanic/teichoic acid biosynthesis glycosyltransferase